jgi:amino acid adenylation domain-containing protein/FkbM family methyltransferase
VIISVIAVLLKKYSSKEIVIIETPFYGINKQSGNAGSFVPLIFRTDNSLTLKDFVRHNKDIIKQSYQQQHFAGGLSRLSRFSNVMITYEGLHQQLSEETTFSRYDLMIGLRRSNGALQLTIDFSEAQFEQAFVILLEGHFNQVLSCLEKWEGITLADVELLTEQEKRMVIERGAGEIVPEWKEKTIIELFKQQVKRGGQRNAVVLVDNVMTYAELDKESGQLAAYLKKTYNLGPRCIAGVMLERSEKFIISILAILKTGAAYLPIDPSYPPARRNYIFSNSGLHLLITESDFVFDLEGYSGNLFAFDIQDFHNHSDNDFKSDVYPSDLAYIIYTSGTTGLPKGVMIEHRSVCNMVLDQIARFSIKESDNLLQFASISFDASVYEILIALLSGATLTIVPQKIVSDTIEFVQYLKHKKVTVATLPPSYLSLLDMAAVAFLRVIITAGEAPNIKDALFLADRCEYYNAFGPTECAVCVSIYKVESKGRHARSIPVGRPLSNIGIFILGSDGELLPWGIKGEIVVSSDVSIARGYLNEDELTKHKFLSNPFIAGARMYRTGDYGRWLVDGNLEFLGREDRQIKVSGQRIELGEVENTLKKHPSIADACIIAKKNSEIDHSLHALITVNDTHAYTLKRIIQFKTSNDDRKRDLFKLPNGMVILHKNRIETEILYKEIFKEKVYLREGITLSDGDTVFDVGANIGLFSLYAGMHLRVNLFVFEPVKTLYDTIQVNLAWYNVAAKTFNIGLFSEECELPFKYYVNNTAMSGIYGNDADERNTVETYAYNDLKNHGLEAELEKLNHIVGGKLAFEMHVCRMRRLSDVMREMDVRKIDLLKIDVEKSEWNVLLGIDEEDWVKIRQVVVEVHDMDGALENVVKLLQTKGYYVGWNQDVDFSNTNIFMVYARRTETSRSNQEITPVRFNNDGNWSNADDLIMDIRKTCGQWLPEYMIPQSFILIDKMPLTANGKVDFAAVAQIDTPFDQGALYVAPRTDIEQRLKRIWEEVLNQKDIGVAQDFFELGGYSLKAIRIISMINKEFSVALELDVFFDNPTIEQLAFYVGTSSTTEFESIELVEYPDTYPEISLAQTRLWILNQLNPGSAAYNLPAAYRLSGHLDMHALNHSLEALLSRHEILRTVFKTDENGTVRQYVQQTNETGFSMAYHDMRQHEKKREKVRSEVQRDFNVSFDLSTGPLLRVSVYQMSDDEWVLSFVMHHFISDGWSVGVMINDLLHFYNSYRGNRPALLNPLRIQYKEYSEWQRKQLSGDTLSKHRAYWLSQFADEWQVLNLPVDKVRPSVKTFAGGMVEKKFSASLTEPLKVLIAEHSSTLFNGLLALTNILLYRYTDQDDIIIGSPVAGRNHSELENQIGFYVNTLPLRTRFSGQNNFLEILENIKTVTLDAYKHQSYPFDELVGELQQPRDLSRNPLFDVMVAWQEPNLISEEEQHSLGLKIERFNDPEHLSSQFDLSFNFFKINENLYVTIEYNSDLFCQSTIDRMTDHLEQLLTSILTSPHQAINSLNYLTEKEVSQLEEFSTSTVNYPKDKTLIGLFEEQAVNTPHNVALVFEELELTYHELNRQANSLAAFFQSEHCVAQGDRVGILLNRNEWMIIAVLAVLKCNAAYVPIDTLYPQERIDFIVEDSNCRIVVDEGILSDYLKDTQRFLGSNLQISSASDSEVYVIYTSGTTGKPKGVAISNRNVTNIAMGWIDAYRLRDISVSLLQITSLSFDVFMGDFCRSFLSGGKMILCPDWVKLNPQRLYDIMYKNRVNIVESPPGILFPLMDYVLENNKQIDFLKILIFGSDTLNLVAYQNLMDKIGASVRIINSYGATETSIDSSYYEGSLLTKDKLNGGVPIGKPFPNLSLYILDSRLNVQPIGIAGEICIGGEGLAEGYLNAPQLTAMKFITNPFKEGQNMYKTGDLGRWLPDGNIEFIGRKDEQVKIRGNRVELAEIENVLLLMKDVDAAVVIALQNDDGEKELIAYLQSKVSLDVHDIRYSLTQSLPVYMIPNYYVQLPQLPLNANGKIDRSKLPSHKVYGLPTATEYVAPRTETEKKLVLIWQDILGRKQVGITDNFFEIGGHSVKLMRIVSKVATEFDVNVNIELFFREPFIEMLAKYIDAFSRIEDQVSGTTEELLF